jgi:2-C-methyl-D-erythritol 4-phosphate cytidylyltransferase
MAPAPHQAVGVVLAAGLGTRVGADGNKAYLRIAGRSMVSWSVSAVAETPGVARTVLVYRRGERDLAARTMASELPSLTVELVEGGETRHGSEWNVLRYLAGDIDAGVVDLVLIHDGARPLAGADLMSAALRVAAEHGGAIPGVPAPNVVGVDAADGVRVIADDLVRVQTPQAFRARELLTAYRHASEDGFDGTDTAACVQQYTDVSIHVFPGVQANLKVTFPADVEVAARLLGDVSAAGSSR